MTVKVLQPPLRRGDSFIIGVNGRLRVVDPQHKPCHGYQTGCVCRSCMERELDAIEAGVPRSCECEHPMRLAGSENCHRCGHRVEREPIAA